MAEPRQPADPGAESHCEGPAAWRRCRGDTEVYEHRPSVARARLCRGHDSAHARSLGTNSMIETLDSATAAGPASWSLPPGPGWLSNAEIRARTVRSTPGVGAALHEGRRRTYQLGATADGRPRLVVEMIGGDPHW